MGLRNPNRWLRHQPISEDEGGELASDVRRKLRGYVSWELERGDNVRIIQDKLIKHLMRHYIGKSFDAFYSHLKKVDPTVRINEIMKYQCGIVDDDGYIKLEGYEFFFKPRNDSIFINRNTMMIILIKGSGRKSRKVNNELISYYEERRIKEELRLKWVKEHVDEFLKKKVMSNRKKKRIKNHLIDIS